MRSQSKAGIRLRRASSSYLFAHKKRRYSAEKPTSQHRCTSNILALRPQRWLIQFALYEAYGTRPYEWGDDPDRQKANTKEEETDLGLLNEGMRYRDLDTGVFLTRDPIGYADGPNVYCYVHCNPIGNFDAWGLEVKAIEDPEDENHTIFSISATVVFDDPSLTEKNDKGGYVRQDRRNEIVDNVKASLKECFTGEDGDKTWTLENLQISMSDSASDVKNENDHIILVSNTARDLGKSAGMATPGGGMAIVRESVLTPDNKKTVGHEFMHLFGLRDNILPKLGMDANLSYNFYPSDNKYTEMDSGMVKQMRANYKMPGAINNNLGSRKDPARLQGSNFGALKKSNKIRRRRNSDEFIYGSFNETGPFTD